MHSKIGQLNKPVVDLEAQGRLLVVRTRNLDVDLPASGGRGNVDVFSRSSRIRLLRKIARVAPVPSKGFRSNVSFLTLTTRAFFHPREAKAYLRAFLKRLYRKFPRVAVIWRMEYQKRGAPHFHLILYNCPYVDKVWIQEQWGEIVGQEMPFTRIEAIRSYKHLVNYASKYAAKIDDCGFNIGAYLAAGENVDEYKSQSAGRVWGVWHRDSLPWAEKLEKSIPCDGAWWMVRRYCMKFYPWIEESSEFGFTVFCEDPYHALEHIVTMSKYFVGESVS